MRYKFIQSLGLFTGVVVATAAFVAAPAMANNRPVAIYSYASSENYCPAGLQPVSLNGVICCGTPNQSTSYQQMIRHASGTASTTRRTVCPVGEKGCSTR